MSLSKHSPHHPEDPWNRNNKEEKIKNKHSFSLFSFLLSFFIGFFFSIFGILLIAILTKQSQKAVKYSFFGAALGFFLPLYFFFVYQ